MVGNDMKFKIFENDTEINRIVASEEFVKSYCAENGYTYKAIIPEKKSRPYSDMELAQQDITDLQLSDIAQGQAMTDLELMMLEVQSNV